MKPDVNNKLSPQSDQPLYRQIGTILTDQIERGTLAPGDPLPSERTLADDYGISRMTARQALAVAKLTIPDIGGSGGDYWPHLRMPTASKRRARRTQRSTTARGCDGMGRLE